ncbi:MAG: hypothetical protein AB7I37_19550 [Pirellulales bacterium]
MNNNQTIKELRGIVDAIAVESATDDEGRIRVVWGEFDRLEDESLSEELALLDWHGLDFELRLCRGGFLELKLLGLNVEFPAVSSLAYNLLGTIRNGTTFCLRPDFEAEKVFVVGVEKRVSCLTLTGVRDDMRLLMISFCQIKDFKAGETCENYRDYWRMERMELEDGGAK